VARAEVAIVYDASNSMWGQIDGRHKVEIARKVLGELITDWQPGTPLALVAYGHRRQGDCADI
jgi:Ca-activated chloride channel family protein